MPSKSFICNLVVLRARDLERSEIFYRALGMLFERHAYGSGPLHLASESEGQVFELYPLNVGDLPTTSARIGFSVPSVDDTFDALLAAGGIEVSLPKDSPWGRRAVVADPDGHRIELTAR